MGWREDVVVCWSVRDVSRAVATKCKMLTHHVAGFHIALALRVMSDLGPKADIAAGSNTKASEELELPHISHGAAVGQQGWQ